MPTRSMLVNFAGYPNEVFNLMPDNGLANLAACLLQEGHETVIWDCSTVGMVGKLFPYRESTEMKVLGTRIVTAVENHQQPGKEDIERFYDLENRIDRYQDTRIRVLGRRMAEFARRERLDFVGFKLWTGIGFHGSMILAQEIKRANPGIRVFGGGPHVDWFMHRVFDVTNVFDVLAYGEGENTIIQLAECAEGKRAVADVANAIYPKGDRIATNPQSRVEDLDSVPLPCYEEDVYLAMKGDEKIKVVLLDESRGCANSCNFCPHPGKSGHRRRQASPAGFVDRLEQMIQRYGLSVFRFAGSNPPVGLRRRIAKEIVRRGLDVRFSAFAHVRGANIDDLRLLKKAGCVALAFGVESGSQRILDESMNKRVKVEQIRKALRQCREADIPLIVSLIVPAPSETEESKEETLRLLQETRPDSTIVSFPFLMAGTKWEREKGRFGFDIRDLEGLYRRAMTHRVNLLAPAVLWRPLEDYRLDGKTFRDLGRERAAFVERVRKTGLATQLFDQVFLIASAIGIPAVQLGNMVGRCMATGDVEKMRGVVAQVNRTILAGSVPAVAR